MHALTFLSVHEGKRMTERWLAVTPDWSSSLGFDWLVPDWLSLTTPARNHFQQLGEYYLNSLTHG